MEQLEGVEQIVLFEEGDGAQQIAPREAELRAVPRRALPVACPPGRQARADADARPHPHLLRDLVDQRQLRGLLHHQDHVPAELRGEQGGLDVLLVLVAVADDQPLLVLQHRHHGEQLRLRARLEPEVVGAAVLHQPLDQIAVLVDLDRVDAAVAPLVAVLGDGAGERLVELDHAGLDDLREADQQRQADPPLAHLVHELLQIDRRRPLPARVDHHAAGVVDGEIVVAPTPDVVEVEGVGRRPAAGKRGSSHLGRELPSPEGLKIVCRTQERRADPPGRTDFNMDGRGDLPQGG